MKHLRIVIINDDYYYCDKRLFRKHHCLQTLFLLFRFVKSEIKQSFVSRTNTLLVGTLEKDQGSTLCRI